MNRLTRSPAEIRNHSPTRTNKGLFMKRTKECSSEGAPALNANRCARGGRQVCMRARKEADWNVHTGRVLSSGRLKQLASPRATKMAAVRAPLMSVQARQRCALFPAHATSTIAKPRAVASHSCSHVRAPCARARRVV